MINSKWAKRVFTTLCLIPWLILFGAYFEIVLTRLALSRWPRFITDDPNIVAVEPLHLLVMLLFISLPAVIPLMVVLALWKWRKLLKDWRYSIHIGGFAVGLIVLWLLIHLDPGGFWNWYFD